jgi:hypothetical protein
MDQPNGSFARGLKRLEPEPEGVTTPEVHELKPLPWTIRPVFLAQVPTLRFLFLRGVDFDIILPIDGLSQGA